MRLALKSSPLVPAGRVVPSSGSHTTLNESGMRSSPRMEVPDMLLQGFNARW